MQITFTWVKEKEHDEDMRDYISPRYDRVEAINILS